MISWLKSLLHEWFSYGNKWAPTFPKILRGLAHAGTYAAKKAG